MPENINKKTTCNKKIISKVLPAPTAEGVAGLTDVTESYAKKIITGARPANTQKAKKVKYCYDALMDVRIEAVKAVVKVMDKKDSF